MRYFLDCRVATLLARTDVSVSCHGAKKLLLPTPKGFGKTSAMTNV